MSTTLETPRIVKGELLLIAGYAERIAYDNKSLQFHNSGRGSRRTSATFQTRFRDLHTA